MRSLISLQRQQHRRSKSTHHHQPKPKHPTKLLSTPSQAMYLLETTQSTIKQYTTPEITYTNKPRQFYALCLRHHPDHNRKDPEAGQKFARLSTAYNTLRNATKRAAYDRQNGFQSRPSPTGSHSSHTANPHKGGQGSYAGSRPASGLSKQRGTFTGPPPSFYAQGGYGRTGRQAEGAYTGSGSAFGFGNGENNGNASSRKQDDPEDPMGFIYRNPLGHFNARAHFRTQSAEDRRRVERRAAQRAAMKDDFLRTHGGGHIDFTLLFSILGVIIGVVTIGGMALPRESTAAGMADAMEAARRRNLKEKAGPSSS